MPMPLQYHQHPPLPNFFVSLSLDVCETFHDVPLPLILWLVAKSCTTDGWNPINSGINMYKPPINWCRICWPLPCPHPWCTALMPSWCRRRGWRGWCRGRSVSSASCRPGGWGIVLDIRDVGNPTIINLLYILFEGLFIISYHIIYNIVSIISTVYQYYVLQVPLDHTSCFVFDLRHIVQYLWFYV